MGAMNTLRENTAVILWILVLSFGVIWTLQDSEVFDAVNRPDRNAAVVDGEPVTNQEYQNALQQQRQQLSQQADGEITSRVEEMARQRAYQQVVNSQLLEMEMKRLGMSVTDSEVEAMVFGENPDPLIRQQFSDSTGQINYQLLQNMAENPQANPQFLQLEDYLTERRRQQKMNSLVQSTVFVSAQDVEEYHWRQNVEASVEYVALRYASVPDDSVTVSESDLRSYYRNNKDDFKREKTVSLDFVTLPKTPTAEDTAAIADDLRSFRDEFAAAENDSLFVSENASERSFTSVYQTPPEMDEAVADSVFAAPEPGRIVGPVFGSSLGHLVKIRDVRPTEDTYVHARHILLESDGANAEKETRLESIRDSIAVGDAGFARMARRYSQDQTASDGGDLGWFGPGRMADAFERAAFNASPGDVVGPIRSEFGYHLIHVEGRTSSAVQIADLAFDLSPSRATLTDKETALEDVAFYAEDGGNFEEEARRRDLEVQQVEAEVTQSTVPGIGQSTELRTFLESAEEGQISDVIEAPDRFAVARVTNVTPEGYRPFEEVKAEIRPRVTLEKKKDVQVRRMRRALDQNGFDQLPQVLDTELRTQSEVTFSTNTVPGVGRDPSFAGTVFGLEEGNRSSVVEGENAAFVVRLLTRQDPAVLSDAEREKIRQKLLQQRRREVFQQWIAALKEDATITDNRSAGQLR